MFERKLDKRCEVESLLWHDDLQLIPEHLAQRCAGLWADADPVDAFGQLDGAIGFNGDLEALVMQGVDQLGINLQQRFATGQDAKRPNLADWPQCCKLCSQGLCIGEFAPEGAVGAHELRIAEGANSAGTVLFASRPEVTAGKPAEYGRPSSMRPLALERVKNLFDPVVSG